MDLQVRHQKHARLLYTRFNKKYFAGKLPKVELEVHPGLMRCNSYGETQFEGDKAVLVRIAEANWKVGAKNTFLKATILHEQAHIKLGPHVDHESPEWKAEILRLSRLGALVETI